MKALRLLCGVGALSAAALGVAGPASAEPAAGAYLATITNAVPPGIAGIGGTMDVMLNSCGPGCTGFITSEETAWFGNLTWQGTSWVGPLQNALFASDCNGTMDDAATSFVINCPADGETVTYSMVKTG